MKTVSEYLANKYFKCNKYEKKYWIDLYLRAYFKEQKQK